MKQLSRFPNQRSTGEGLTRDCAGGDCKPLFDGVRASAIKEKGNNLIYKIQWREKKTAK